MNMAREFGAFPWEIAGGSKLGWWFRWKVHNDLVTEVKDSDG